MPHEDYVPASQSPDYTFDPASLYRTEGVSTLIAPSPAEPPVPPAPLRARAAKLGLAIALAGVISLLVGSAQNAKARATHGWVETTAQIVSAKIRATSADDYHLDLGYRYRAGPRELPGSRIALEPARTRDAVYAYAARFRPGATVPVWFDPSAPSSAVLERPRVLAPWAPSVLGIALLAAGLAPFALKAFHHLRYRLALRRRNQL